MTAAPIAEPADVVDPTGRRHRLALSPAGHVALFARALHAAQAGEVRRRAGARALVEACAVERDGGGRVRPRRSGHSGNFPVAAGLGSDRVGDRGRRMRLRGTRNLKAGPPGRWCRILCGGPARTRC
jgi:hypothetical protein